MGRGPKSIYVVRVMFRARKRLRLPLYVYAVSAFRGLKVANRPIATIDHAKLLTPNARGRSQSVRFSLRVHACSAAHACKCTKHRLVKHIALVS